MCKCIFYDYYSCESIYTYCIALRISWRCEIMLVLRSHDYIEKRSLWYAPQFVRCDNFLTRELQFIVCCASAQMRRRMDANRQARVEARSLTHRYLANCKRAKRACRNSAGMKFRRPSILVVYERFACQKSICLFRVCTIITYPIIAYQISNRSQGHSRMLGMFTSKHNSCRNTDVFRVSNTFAGKRFTTKPSHTHSNKNTNTSIMPKTCHLLSQHILSRNTADKQTAATLWSRPRIQYRRRQTQKLNDIILYIILDIMNK